MASMKKWNLELNRRRLLSAGVAGFGAAFLPTPLRSAAPALADIRLIAAAPSPYTQRMDSIRAGYGIKSALEARIRQLDLPWTVGYFDAVKRLDDPDSLGALFSGSPRAVIIGSSTWGQGSNRYVRQLFEVVPQQSLLDVQASSWVTSGGAHTGGEVVAQDIQRSMMGIGASAFNLGQKLVVFTTDERDDLQPGEFTLIDVWVMDQFAQMIILKSLQRGGPGLPPAAEAQAAFGFNIDYFSKFPLGEAEVTQEIRRLRRFLNRATGLSSPERVEILNSLQ
jgi:hypothetical protein